MAEDERRAKQVAAIGQSASQPTVEPSDGGNVHITQLSRDEGLPAEEREQGPQATLSPMIEPPAPTSAIQRTLDVLGDMVR